MHLVAIIAPESRIGYVNHAGGATICPKKSI